MMSRPLVKKIMEMPPQEVNMDGVKNTTIRKVFTSKDGAPTFAMRLFEVAPGGHTPLHTHPHEHEVYIVEGKATMQMKDASKVLEAGDAVFVPPQALHQFRNDSDQSLRFLCFVPVEAS